MKVILALGGWTDSGTDKYSRLVGDAESRRRFVDKAVQLLTDYGFDGLSLDWHYPVCWQVNCNNPKGSADREGKGSFYLIVYMYYISLSSYNMFNLCKVSELIS